jgi:hypothetical protein
MILKNAQSQNTPSTAPAYRESITSARRVYVACCVHVRLLKETEHEGKRERSFFSGGFVGWGS